MQNAHFRSHFACGAGAESGSRSIENVGARETFDRAKEWQRGEHGVKTFTGSSASRRNSPLAECEAERARDRKYENSLRAYRS